MYDRHSFLSDGVRLAYIDEGSGPPVLLVHGFASNVATNWIDTSWVRTLLAAGHRVIAYDNRGHGGSEKLYDQAAYGARLMGEDARRMLDHLGLEKAHILGYSMGARIATFMALAHPDRVRSAILGGLGINILRGLVGARPIAQALLAPSLADVTNETARTFRAFAEQTGGDLKALAACILASREAITTEMLAGIRVPVLVAVGSDDVIGGSATALAALIPGAEAHVIAGRDHMKAVGDKGFKEAVLAWLARHP